MKKKYLLTVAALPVVAGLVGAGCSGGGDDNDGPFVPSTGTVAQGQADFQAAIDAFDASGNPQNATVKSKLASAIEQFEGAVRRDPNGSDANAGLASALFAQSLVEGEANPLINRFFNTEALQSSKALGLDKVVVLKSKTEGGLIKSAATAPIATVEALLPKSKSQYSTAANVSSYNLKGLQDYINNRELPRLQRIVTALGKVSKSSSSRYKIYTEKNGSTSTNKYLYGPNFQIIEGVARLELGVLATLVGYDFDSGTFYNNVSTLGSLDKNNDNRVTPTEYFAPNNFGKLRSNGASNLSLALTQLRSSANVLETGINAQVAFSAPSDALIRLSSEDKASLSSNKKYLTQAKTVLAGSATYPIDGEDRTINLPEFYNTPAADLRTVLPTLRIDGDDNIIGIIAAQDPKLSGALPGGSTFLFEKLVG